jgi:hypothetical protein
MTSRTGCVEPISKSSEEDNEAGELDKTEEVLGVILPADEDAALPLDPSEEALDEPASHVRLSRRGAIISMPSRRNSSSSGSLS